MILEGIVTTLNSDGTVNVAPMGPEVDEPLTRLVLKPYQTSTTYGNLQRAGQGVFHVTDDVELLARAAIGAWGELPRLMPASAIEGKILSDACRWYAFRVQSIDNQHERTEIVCRVVDEGRLRDFWGFNRGKHAVLEAAILATRTKFLPAEEILSKFEHLRALVQKTGGAAEHRAFQILTDFVQSEYGLKQG